MPNASALQLIGIAKETTPGTYKAPTTADHGMLPVTSCEPKAVEPRAEDRGTRSTMRAQVFDAYQTTQHYEITLKGDIFAGSFGHLLMACFGTDTTTGSGPYVHTFSVADTTYPGVASYTIHHFDNANGANGWGYTGCWLKSLSLEYDKQKLASYTAVFLGAARASQAKPSLAVESGSGYGPISGHLLSMTIGGSAHTEFEKFGVELDRGTEVRQTFNGARTPNSDAIAPAPPQGTFKATTFYDDQTDYNRFANASESTVVATLGSTNPVVTFTATEPDWRTAEVKPGDLGDIMRLDIEGTLKYSATDTGICKVALTNGRSAGY